MSLDLSFWEPPDWKRETRVNPLFWVFVAVVIGVGGLSIGLTVALQRATELGAQHDMYKIDMARISAQYNGVEKSKKLYQSIEKGVLLNLRERVARRRAMAPTLSKLFKMVNDDIVFDALSLKGVETVGQKGASIKSMRYSLIVSGTVFGTDSEDKLSEFQQLFKDEEQGFGESMLSSEVTQIDSSGEESGVAKTVFTIKSEFKEK